MEGFASYEIPTCGKRPPLRLMPSSDEAGPLTLVDSPWMLLLRRAGGTPYADEAYEIAVPRLTAVRLHERDELFCPPSETTPVEPRALLEAKLTGIRRYAMREDAAVWWWYRRELSHDRVLHLHQASSNASLSISIAGSCGFEGSWCYGDHDLGWRAALGWNGWGDPPDGWHRHLETARRRKDGTVETEYVYAYEGGKRIARDWAR